MRLVGKNPIIDIVKTRELVEVLFFNLHRVGAEGAVGPANAIKKPD